MLMRVCNKLTGYGFNTKSRVLILDVQLKNTTKDDGGCVFSLDELLKKTIFS